MIMLLKCINKLVVSQRGFALRNQKYEVVVNVVAFYSRSNSKNSHSPYKLVRSRPTNEAKEWLETECGPNWELFPLNGHRFYLPGNLGPAWQNAKTIIKSNTDLNKLIDFESKEPEKLYVSSKLCPLLIRKNLQELFPTPEVASKEALTLITLSSSHTDIEGSAQKFVLAAKEISTKLRKCGYWADFMNPFSGKPFYSYSNGRRLYKYDDRFRGIGIKFEMQNDCLVISSEKEAEFSGNVFTNAPGDILLLQSLIID